MFKLSKDIFAPLDAVKVYDKGQRFDQRAAVLFVIQETAEGMSILLTQRADKLRHHGGEVAFPGGMWEESDQFPVDTALRESYEEVNLPADSVEIMGQLPPTWSRTGTEVTPIVAWLKSPVDLKANIEETQAIFWLPVSYLLDDPRERTDIFSFNRQDVWVPAYKYGKYEIWGLTSSVIMGFLRQCLSHRVQREHSSPERRWQA